MLSFDDPDPNKARANRKNHEGVTFEEAKTVFDDAQNLTVSDFESDPDEERSIMVGMIALARLLVVVIRAGVKRSESFQRGRRRRASKGSTANNEKRIQLQQGQTRCQGESRAAA